MSSAPSNSAGTYAPAVFDSFLFKDNLLVVGVAIRTGPKNPSPSGGFLPDERLTFYVDVPPGTPGGPVSPGASHIKDGKLVLTFHPTACNAAVDDMAAGEPYWASLQLIDRSVRLTIGMTDQRPPPGAPFSASSTVGVPFEDINKLFSPAIPAISFSPVVLAFMKEYMTELEEGPLDENGQLAPRPKSKTLSCDSCGFLLSLMPDKIRDASSIRRSNLNF